MACKGNIDLLVSDLKNLVHDFLSFYAIQETSEVFNKKIKDFNIGSVNVKNPFVCAPLAGISDNTYRIFSKFFGSSLSYSEMITSYGTIYEHKRSIGMSEITEYERPCAVQLFGCNSNVMAQAAQIIEPNADIIDINMGCPVSKVLKTGSGGYLLNDEEKIGLIVKSIVEKVNKPVTVKTRLGWDKNSINIMNVSKIVQESGASAIAIHGRTVKQGYSGNADYEHIKKVKEKLKIPVIVSGDINTAAQAMRVIDYTRCDGLMIGRASRGSTWVFLEMLLYMLAQDSLISYNYRSIADEDNIDLRKKFAKLYIDFLIYFKGYDRAIKEFRKYLSWIFKGYRNINRYKEHFFNVCTYEEIIAIIDMI